MCQKGSLDTQCDFFFNSNIFQFYTFILKVQKCSKKQLGGSFIFNCVCQIALEQANITMVEVYATGTVQ